MHSFIISHFYSNKNNNVNIDTNSKDESKNDSNINIKNSIIENISNKDIQLNILDLGSGPGVIALILAEKYPNSNIIGVDISDNQIKYAKLLSKQRKLDKNSQFFVGGAETLCKDLGNKYLNHFDIVICGQCWCVQ